MPQCNYICLLPTCMLGLRSDLQISLTLDQALPSLPLELVVALYNKSNIIHIICTCCIILFPKVTPVYTTTTTTTTITTVINILLFFYETNDIILFCVLILYIRIELTRSA